MRLTTRRAYLATVAAVVVAIVSSPTLAQVGISLNLRYDDPNSPAAGGTWQMVTQFDGLAAGDTDRDFDVDTADVTTVISNFTGAGGTGKNWDLGDFDSDTDVDTADITAGIGNFTGALAIHGADQGDHPDLDYKDTTGELSIYANGHTILSFNLQSADRFSGNADFSQLELDTFAVPGLSDNLPNALGWVSALATGGQGYTGDKGNDNKPASLGLVFPTGLTFFEVESMLTNNAWAGPSGTGGAFGIHPFPEPTSLLLASLCGLGLLTMRRRLFTLSPWPLP